MGFCLSENVFTPPATFDTPTGGACMSGTNTCQSFWCNTGTMQCIETCSRNSDCAGITNNCWMYTQDDGAGNLSYDHLCFAQDTLNLNGAACTANANCRSGICNRYESVCAAQCCTDADCGPLQSCAIYDVDAATAVKVCRNRGTGTAALGDACTAPADCESEVCAPVDPADVNSPRKCSTLCCRDSDCAILPLGGSCEPVATPITNQIAGACTPN
jgi:hypothetical protein